MSIISNTTQITSIFRRHHRAHIRRDNNKFNLGVTVHRPLQHKSPKLLVHTHLEDCGSTVFTIDQLSLVGLDALPTTNCRGFSIAGMTV